MAEMKKLDRRTFLTGMAASGVASAALATSWPVRSHAAAPAQRDVSWLAEIQTAPATLPANTPQLSNLLQDAQGQPIKTLADWQKKRDELRRWWLEFLGPAPAARKAKPEFKIVSEETAGNVVRRLVRYEVEPGETIEAYWMQPTKPAANCPAAVVFHSTVEHTIQQPAGLGPDLNKAFGLKLAERGFVTFSPRNFLWPATGKANVKNATERFLQRHPQTKGMHRMLLDALVAVDILAQLPHVDTQRICSVGHSLGAKEVLYLAAFDERVKVTVSSEGGIGTKFSNWDALWYLGPEIKSPNFQHEHHELLALAAPRPFLLVGGDSADGDRGWPFIESALPIYKLYGGPARVGQYNHKLGHEVPPEAEKRIYEWLETYA